MFFKSWQLWEKMSFILGVSLLIVFMFGWTKLAWRIRRMKKQEVVDEEKRSRLRELRAGAQRGESRGKHDIPFGVRAIQSGIEVDGIWISNSNTPVPSELTLSSIPGESSDDLAKNTPKPPSNVISLPKPRPSLRVRPPSRPDSFVNCRTKSEILQDIIEGRTARTSYKPRRSSHLRYGGQGDYIEDSLKQLEGSSISRKKTSSPRSRGCPPSDRDADSSVADNERNSGTSDESDATLSQEPPVKGDPSLGSNLNVTLDDNTEKTLLNYSLQLPKQPSEETTSQRPEKIEPPKNPYEAVMSYFMQSESQEEKEPESTGSETGPSRVQSSPQFKPGELHMNKSSRKVNTGFEILPAGTFGIPIELNINYVEPAKREDLLEKRPTAKLQKKPPESTSQRVHTFQGKS